MYANDTVVYLDGKKNKQQAVEELLLISISDWLCDSEIQAHLFYSNRTNTTAICLIIGSKLNKTNLKGCGYN